MSMTGTTFRRSTNLIRPCRSRFLSSSPPKPELDAAAQKAQSRIERTRSKLPRFLQKYTVPLRNAPVTHITSFLLLHEITAVVPLFGLAAVFHYTQWMPPFISEGKWVSDGVEKFGGHFRKKGWLGDEGRGRWKWWGRGEGGVRIVVEFATAYAVVKALLPLRLVFSVWATPAFARGVTIPIGRIVKRVFSRVGKRTAESSSAAGTGATAAGAVAKNGSTKPGSSGTKSTGS